ncbi:MAG: methyltransferase domain-containing protein [Roseiarcus sp.]|jgi:hypothetical protein
MPDLSRLVDYSNPNSLGSRLRLRRRHHLEGLIEAIYQRKGSVRIVDLGGRREYWKLFDDLYLRSRKVHVTLVNPEYTPTNTDQVDPNFLAVSGDGCSLPCYQDNSFDLTHSNSTIEHVGTWERMEAFAQESRRLAPAYYLQTPYFWFPIEPHFLAPFFHWLPESWRAKALLTKWIAHESSSDLGESMRRVRSAVLLDKAQLSFLLPDGTIRFEWIGVFPKSLIAIRQPPIP